MSTRPAGLLASTVFLAREVNRPLGTPLHMVVSVVTIGVLELGVSSAGDRATRARPVVACRAVGITLTVRRAGAPMAATAIDARPWRGRPTR